MQLITKAGRIAYYENDEDEKPQHNFMYPWDSVHEDLVADDFLIEQCLRASGVDRCGNRDRQLDDLLRMNDEDHVFCDDR